MASSADEMPNTDSAAAGTGRRASANDMLGTSDRAGQPMSGARIAHDTLGTSDSTDRSVLLTLGPAVVRTSASLELKIIRAHEIAPTDTTHVLEGRSVGTSSTMGDLTVTPSEAPEAERETEVPCGIEIGVTRPAWLIGTATAMGGLSQIVAPNNRAVGLASVAIGYAWARWRWNQRD
jgi:hypothetical protein